MSAEFDEHAKTYRADVDRAIAFSGRDVGFFAEHKALLLKELAATAFGNPGACSILDVGCGIGLIDGHLAATFAEVAGADVSEAELAVARAENPSVTYDRSSERELPYETGMFGIVFAACVFHHVDPEAREQLAREMCRVAKPGGLVVVFEHNPWNPLTRLVVRRTSFDAGVELIPPGNLARYLAQPGMGSVAVSFITFTPFNGGWARRAERKLARVPLGAQYLVVARKAVER